MTQLGLIMFRALKQGNAINLLDGTVRPGIIVVEWACNFKFFKFL